MVKDGQNIFDYCIQVYGQLDGMITDLLNPNNLHFSSELQGGQELVINYNAGNEEIKEFININGLTICNNIDVNSTVSLDEPYWILRTGFWDDLGIWIDTKTWID